MTMRVSILPFSSGAWSSEYALQIRARPAVHAGARLDDVRHILGLRLLVEVLHGLAAELLVLRQVEIAAGGNALQFLRPEGELVKDSTVALA